MHTVYKYCYTQCAVCWQTTLPRPLRVASSRPGWTTAMQYSTACLLQWSTYCSECRTTWPELSARAEAGPTPDHSSGRSIGCPSGSESDTRWRRRRSRSWRHQRLHTWVTWSRQLFRLGLCDHPMPHCWLFPECELNSLDEHSRSRNHKHETLSLLTLDPALPYRHLNAISKPTFTLILNWRHKCLCIPRRTLWRYTNVVLLLLLLLLYNAKKK